jgi:hypothetical protein
VIDAGIGKGDAMEGRREAAKEKVAQEELKVKRQPHEVKPHGQKVKHQRHEVKPQPPKVKRQPQEVNPHRPKVNRHPPKLKPPPTKSPVLNESNMVN